MMRGYNLLVTNLVTGELLLSTIAVSHHSIVLIALLREGIKFRIPKPINGSQYLF
jgi:hypothetical protein